MFVHEGFSVQILSHWVSWETLGILKKRPKVIYCLRAPIPLGRLPRPLRSGNSDSTEIDRAINSIFTDLSTITSSSSFSASLYRNLSENRLSEEGTSAEKTRFILRIVRRWNFGQKVLLSDHGALETIFLVLCVLIISFLYKESIIWLIADTNSSGRSFLTILYQRMTPSASILLF